jgi:hypothetical protein
VTTKDVGDGYPIGYEARDPDTRELVAATVVLTVTDPAGVESTPTPANPSTGVYRATITLSAAGRWRWRWDVTGTVVDVAHGEVRAADPALGDLASTADVEALLGRALTDPEKLRVGGLLSSASTKLRAYCRRSFSEVAGDSVDLRPVGTVLRLPNKATAVSSVTQIGTSGTAERLLSTSEWAWDGIDQIDIWPIWPCPPANVPPTGSYANTYRVVYDHSAGGVPDFIRDMCVDMAQDALLAPSQTTRVNSERIGSYSYQMGQGGSGSAGAAVRLTAEQKRDLAEAGYRRRAGSVQLQAA